MPAIADLAPRLGPIVRLLASDQAGEVSAAVGGLRRILASEGLDLNDLAGWIEQAADVPLPTEAQLREWISVVDFLIAQNDGVLSPRDVDFLNNVRRAAYNGKAPSPGQQKWLGDIRSKLGVRARAG